MARPVLTKANLARLSRRTGGLDRLASAYAQQVASLTGELNASFAQYNQRVNAQMAPYEAAVSDYQNVAQPAYQAQLADYNTRLDGYLQELAAVNANPVTERIERQVVGRTWYGKKKYADVTVYDPVPIPTFNETAPSAPSAPSAPTIEKFDTAPFDAKRKALGEVYEREVGERKASRRAAVRRGDRTLLSKVSA
jgi:hypothetical protein